MELADESGAAPSAGLVRTLRRAQDALGRLHDLQVLQHYVSEVAARPQRHLPAPDAGLAILARSIEDECRQLHGRYVAMMPELIETAQTARQDTAVRLTVASRVHTARVAKMPLPSRRRAGSRAASGEA